MSLFFKASRTSLGLVQPTEKVRDKNKEALCPTAVQNLQSASDVFENFLRINPPKFPELKLRNITWDNYSRTTSASA
jgi:hypothetical protein